MYYKKHNLLHIHIPKTAGTSVRYLLDDHLEAGVGPIHGYYVSLLKFINKDTSIITIVRNPYDRVISFYEWIQSGKSDFTCDFVKTAYKKTFSEFVDIYCEHGECQFDFIRGSEHKLIAIRFEDLEHELVMTLNKLGITVDISKLPHMYKNNYDYDKNTYFSNDLMEKIRKKDYEYYEILPSIKTWKDIN